MEVYYKLHYNNPVTKNLLERKTLILLKIKTS